MLNHQEKAKRGLDVSLQMDTTQADKRESFHWGVRRLFKATQALDLKSIHQSSCQSETTIQLNLSCFWETNFIAVLFDRHVGSPSRNSLPRSLFFIPSPRNWLLIDTEHLNQSKKGKIHSFSYEGAGLHKSSTYDEWMMDLNLHIWSPHCSLWANVPLMECSPIAGSATEITLGWQSGQLVLMWITSQQIPQGLRWSR